MKAAFDIISKMPVTWNAQWINPELPHDDETRHPASYLRKRFFAADPASAYLYITCHGLYAAFLNGKRVGEKAGAYSYELSL